MKLSDDKKMRGRSLMPGQRKAPLHRDLVSSVFEASPEYRENVVRVFNDEGLLTTREVGIKRFQFAKLSLFHTLRVLPWSTIITYSVLLYLAIVFIFSGLYYAWSFICGASPGGVTWISSLYFTVVSLAANGGYVGEPLDTMTNPTDVCFYGRTCIVMILSYTNIIFVGLVAALVVGRAEYAGRLGQRIVFSDFCSLTAVPARRDRCWRLTFRMANSIGQRPIAHGRLSLFIITAEPLKDYRRRRKEMLYHQYAAQCPQPRHGTPDELPELRVPARPTLTPDLLREQTEKRMSRASSTLHLDAVRRAGRSQRRRPRANRPVAVPVLSKGEAPTAAGRQNPSGSSSSASGGSASGDSVKTNASDGSRRRVGEAEEADGFARVRICVEEVRWTCSEERYLDMRSGQLSLWFPVSIHHTIDRQSPLYRFVEASQEPSGSPVTGQAPNAHAWRSFQLIATFDAVELESGASITAKRTYTMNDIVAHYRFSNKMVHMRPGSNEVQLDYHYFNEMLPVTAIESSTSGSDVTYS